MPKIDINKVAEAMKNNEVEGAKLRAILEELNILAQAEANEEKPPAVKKQFCILISDPEGLLPKTDFAGWVCQLAEDQSPALLTERILKSADYYNTTRKGRLNPCRTIGEALEYIPAGIFKENDVWVKTKSPVLMLRTDNQIPNPNQGKLFGAGREDAA